MELWQKYIAWEKSNPLRTEDTALLTKRVVFALEQCLLCLGHHPDIWYQAAQFLEYSCKILAEKGVGLLVVFKFDSNLFNFRMLMRRNCLVKKLQICLRELQVVC